MIGFNIGDHRHHGLQVKKGRVTLVGLGDQEAAGTQLGIAANAVDQTTDDKGGIQARLGEDIGNQAGGGGLAVSTRDRDTVAIAHQFRQHFRPGHHRNTRRTGGKHFRVLFVYRARADHHIGAADVALGMTDIHPDPPRLESTGNGTGADIGAGNLIAQVHQHLGNTAHTGAADTDHVNAPDPAHLRHGVGIAFNGHG